MVSPGIVIRYPRNVLELVSRSSHATRRAYSGNENVEGAALLSGQIMKFRSRLLTVCLLAAHAGVAWGSDACSSRAIVTSADVTVSDGSSFRTQSFFHGRDAAAIRHLRDTDQTVAVEGPLGWIRVDDESRLGAGFPQLFALGHQYHAFVLHFDEVVDKPRETPELEFAGDTHRARSGDYPYGGTVHLVDSAEADRPAGLLFEFPETPAIEVTLS